MTNILKTSTWERATMRARELMLPADEAHRYVQISINDGLCPDCKAEVGRYETDRVSHARLCPCKGYKEDQYDRSV